MENYLLAQRQFQVVVPIRHVDTGVQISAVSLSDLLIFFYRCYKNYHGIINNDNVIFRPVSIVTHYAEGVIEVLTSGLGL
jgi:hypothetical protein